MGARAARGRRDELADRGETDPSRELRQGTRPLLLGNNIENPGNVAALRAAAEMFDWECAFVDDARHRAAHPAGEGARVLAARDLAACGVPIIALENTRGAEDLYRFRPPRGRFVLAAGNERRGIAGEILRLADRAVQIPTTSAHLDTVNVAAAAAIAIHHLARGGAATRRGGGHARPDVLLAAPRDPIAAGSVVRSATFFGWKRLFLDDRHAVWFETDRIVRSLGRGAARRGRNPIHVLPARGDPYDEVCVVTALGEGEPLRTADVTADAQRLVVIPDESGGAIDVGPWAALGRRVRSVRLETAGGTDPPFRLVASIVLAEIARRLAVWR